jgi:uncharacterized C2H2 Zn-finger protein
LPLALPPPQVIPSPLMIFNTPEKVTVSTQTCELYLGETNRQCKLCEQLFTSYKGMKLHVARVHTNIKKQAPCPVCDKMFKHKYAVKFHVKQVHEQATRVICPNCNKLFYNKYKLSKHIKNRHLKAI